MFNIGLEKSFLTVFSAIKAKFLPKFCTSSCTAAFVRATFNTQWYYFLSFHEKRVHISIETSHDGNHPALPGDKREFILWAFRGKRNLELQYETESDSSLIQKCLSGYSKSVSVCKHTHTHTHTHTFSIVCKSLKVLLFILYCTSGCT